MYLLNTYDTFLFYNHIYYFESEQSTTNILIFFLKLLINSCSISVGVNDAF